MGVDELGKQTRSEPKALGLTVPLSPGCMGCKTRKAHILLEGHTRFQRLDPARKLREET